MNRKCNMVSIIIPVYNQWTLTEKCLHAILKNTIEANYEIIIVDDCSTDETSSKFDNGSDVIYIRNEQNEGFIKSCNNGAKSANGSIYLFLNNDTEVQEGWLKAILETFENYNDAGIVGSKLLNSDYSLQEAGGIVWSDASAHNYGRNNNPTDWQYNFIREVDYVSGACLAIRKEVWELCGGFDTFFYPAYYEDTDLCFSVRRHGYKVYYQPNSVIIHHEGITSGKNELTGAKKHQITNRKKFYEKWHSILNEKHWYPDPSVSCRAKWHGKKPGILIVDHKVPEQDKDSGSVRMHNIILLLLKKGFRVTIFPDITPEDKYTRIFMDLGVEVIEEHQCFESFYSHNSLQFDVVWLARPDVSFPKLDIVRKYSPYAKTVYDTIDLYFVRTKRQSEIEQSEGLAVRADVYKAQELYLSRFADATIVVTETEKDLLNNIDKTIEPMVISTIHEMPEQNGKPMTERAGLMFLGGFMHTPNVDAVKWFVNEILPIIHTRLDSVVFYIIGSHPTEEVLKLQDDGIVEVIGWVEDLEPWFNKTRVFVSPLRYGAGIKGKNGQAMSYGLPMVTTTIGAEGMRLMHRQNSMISDSPEEFALSVIELYNDAMLWQSISENSVQHIYNDLSPEKVSSKLDELFFKLFNSKNMEDYIRTDIQQLSQQWEEKSNVISLNRNVILNVLKHDIERPVFIWGAGYFGTKSLALLNEIGVAVKGFIDSNPKRHGEVLESLIIQSPEMLVNKDEALPFIVIGVGHVLCKEIEMQLKALGFDADSDYISYHAMMGWS